MQYDAIENSKELEIRKNLDSAKRIASSALDHGRATLESLDRQQEHIQSIEDTLEANDHIIQKSARVLNGMTWAGYISNKCSDLKSTIIGEPSTTSAINIRESTSSTKLPSASNQLSSTSLGFHRTDQNSQPAQDRDLQEITSAVEALHMMGVALGETLDSQKVTLDRIEDKTTTVTDHTLAVTLRTAQLLRKNHKPIQSFVGTFQLVDVSSNRYLSVSAEDNCSIAFTVRGGIASYFHLFVKEGHLYGLLNEKSQRYLGCTVWGTVAVSGNYFGAQEECYLDMGPLAPGAAADRANGDTSKAASIQTAQPTGLLIIARNWGAGGWLKLVPPFAAEASSEADWLTSETTTSITDRQGAVQLQLIRCRVESDRSGNAGTA